MSTVADARAWPRLAAISQLALAVVAFVLLLLLPASRGARAPACSSSHWERRLDTDLTRFELRGISLDDIHHASKQPCGGYIVSIEAGQLFAQPLGWEAAPHIWEQRLKMPHIYLIMLTKLLCRYPDVPDVTFVMNTYDRLCIEDRARSVPVVSWGKDVMANDPQILMPYWTFLHLSQDVEKLGQGPPWEDRKEVAIWRGTTTGGTFAAWNWRDYPRSRLVSACNNSRLCDAKFTGYPQADKETEAAIRNSGFHAPPLDMPDFLKYKYVVVNDGNMAPSSRLSIFLHSGSLLLKQETPSIEWYYDDLRPYVHYLPISYNFGDLEHKVKWAQHNDRQARAMAGRAKAYAEQYLTHDHIYCYLYRLLKRYAAAQRYKAGFHNDTWQQVPVGMYCGKRSGARRLQAALETAHREAQ